MKCTQVVYSDRAPQSWLFYSTKEQAIKRKRPQNVNAAAIADAFSKPAPRDGSQCAGSLVFFPEREGDWWGGLGMQVRPAPLVSGGERSSA